MRPKLGRMDYGISGMTVRVFHCARPAPVNGKRLKMPSEGSDGIGVGNQKR